MSINPKQRFQTLLIELFQLDKTDLDFGIYRIMNLRANDVNQFINDILPAKLNEVSEKLMSKGKSDVAAAADAARTELVKLGVPLTDNDDEIEKKFQTFGNQVPAFKENYERYKRAKEAAHESVKTEELERDIYNDLYRFFDRYYEEGDFVSKPRAGESTFMIPYNGEETKFYWANHDQYYIKTGENFKNYVFTNGEADAKSKVTVEFKLIEAETEVNNNQNKKGRVFIPAENYFDWNADERKLSLSFYYKVPTKEEKETWNERQNNKTDNKGINEKLIFTQLEKLIRETNDAFLIRLWEKERKIKNGNKEENQNEIYYQLNRYTSINSFDYFIHKDLRKFLRQELDYFLKHEIFSLNFLADDWSDEQMQKAMENNRIRATVIRDVAVRLIEFLAEIENFQKMLYEKKKFVVQSDYCITLDLVPDDVFDEVINFILGDAEQKQLKDWQSLGFIESLGITAEDTKADLYLVLDTKFLSAELKFKLLSGIENLDERCGGLLINSDNYQALNFLQTKYKEKVKCVYIDPPYNTGSDGFIYKDGFSHSTWLAMIEPRLKLGRDLMLDESAIFMSIDDGEHENLVKVSEQVFGDNNFISNIIWQKKYSPQNDAKWFSDNHDFIVCFSKNKEKWRPILLERTEKQIARYVNKDNDSRGEWKAADLSVKTYSPDYDYPITTPSGRIVNPPKGRCWMTSKSRMAELIKDNRIWFGSDGDKTPSLKVFLTEAKQGFTPLTIWTYEEVGHNQVATQELKNLGFSEFTSPKPRTLINRIAQLSTNESDKILDYFAGSGTTGHAVINLNREDDGNRKYILVEMGEYFDTVTKPRIQKVIYSADWKNGKPVRNNQPLIDGKYKSNGVSHVFQYLKLEQYEDTLNNIEFDQSREAIAPTFEMPDRIKYLLSYGTDGSQSLLATDKFSRPFEYEMDIVRLNERVPTRIDLVTTFNFLLGIDVVRYRTTDHQNRTYHVIEGIKKKQTYLIVWRNYDGLDLALERDWIKQAEWFDKEATVYSNVDNAFGANGIESEFKRLLTTDEHR